MAFCTLQLNFTPQSHKDEYPECYVVFVKKKKKKKKGNLHIRLSKGCYTLSYTFIPHYLKNQNCY